MKSWVLEKNGKYWGVVYSDGYSTCYGWCQYPIGRGDDCGEIIFQFDTSGKYELRRTTKPTPKDFRCWGLRRDAKTYYNKLSGTVRELTWIVK